MECDISTAVAIPAAIIVHYLVLVVSYFRDTTAELMAFVSKAVAVEFWMKRQYLMPIPSCHSEDAKDRGVSKVEVEQRV